MSTTMSPTADQPTDQQQQQQHPTTDVPPTALATTSAEELSERNLSVFASRSGFDAAVPIAKALASSDIVPAAYHNKPANCLVALELAHRTRASVLMVMQNLHIIKGKPSWGSPFLAAQVNTSARFSPLRYQVEGKTAQPGWRCRAVARDLESDEVLEGTWITHEMAKGEGWYDRNDSKWKTMPEQMIRYRATAFWTRIYAPEIMLGMHTTDELEDMGGVAVRERSEGARDVNAALGLGLRSTPDAVSTEEPEDAQLVAIDEEEQIRLDDLELIRRESRESGGIGR